MYRTHEILSDLHQEKENDPYIFLNILNFVSNAILWKLQMAKLHRAKERHAPSLSNQTSVYTSSPEGGVVWNLPYYVVG